jgi:hypothetical protein
VASELSEAVIDVLAADTTLANWVPSGFWFNETPPDTDPLPNAALFDTGGTQDVFSEGDVIEAARYRLEVYASRDPTLPGTDPARPGQAAGKILARAKDVLNAGTLSLTGWGHYQLRCADRGRLEPVDRRDPEGLRVYKGTLAVYAAVSRAHP